MNPKPWYIWLSIPAFAVLWGDTVRKILLSNKKPLELVSNTHKFNLWLRVLGQMFLSIIGVVIIPMILVGLVFEIVCREFPVLTQVLECIHFLILYASGVYITYKHTLWRKNNITF